MLRVAGWRVVFEILIQAELITLVFIPTLVSSHRTIRYRLNVILSTDLSTALSVSRILP